MGGRQKLSLFPRYKFPLSAVMTIAVQRRCTYSRRNSQKLDSWRPKAARLPKAAGRRRATFERNSKVVTCPELIKLKKSRFSTNRDFDPLNGLKSKNKKKFTNPTLKVGLVKFFLFFDLSPFKGSKSRFPLCNI